MLIFFLKYVQYEYAGNCNFYGIVTEESMDLLRERWIVGKEIKSS